MRSALIIGASGQAGPILAQSLIKDQMSVSCTSRFSAPRGFGGLRKLGIESDVFCYEINPTNLDHLKALIDKIAPEYIFHCAGSASPGQAHRHPFSSLDFAHITLLLLELISTSYCDDVRLRIASSGEVFSDSGSELIDERSFKNARNPYGIEKITASSLVEYYRAERNVNCASLHFFNHESALRSAQFVTMKIVEAAIEIKNGRRGQLSLGNLQVIRDWGWAADYMEAFKLSALSDQPPADYVVATGTSIMLEDFVDEVFSYFSLDWREYVYTDPNFIRSGEPQAVYVDPSRIKAELGWNAQYVGREVPRKLMSTVLDKENV